MAHYSLAKLHRRQRYKLIAGAIVPRPIALVTTLNEDGGCNAAPFSAFNYVCEDPPLIVLGLQVHDDGDRMGEIKDTTRNILRTSEFVVNLLNEDLLVEMVGCATDFPSSVSETTAMGLGLVPSIEVATPRIERSPFALECCTKQILDLSSHRAVVIGEVLSIYARDDVVDPRTLRVDLARYQPVGRLFGSLYCKTSAIVACPTASYASWRSQRDSLIPTTSAGSSTTTEEDDRAL